MDKPTVIFTFDDGLIDGLAWHHVYGLPATYFLIGECFERDVAPGSLCFEDEVLQPIPRAPKIRRENLYRLNRDQCEIASHGHRHVRYNSIPEAEADWDAGQSKLILTIEGPVYSFAFPAQADAHKEIVHKYFPYIRPNMGHTNPMEFPGSVYLYMWHRAIEQRDAGPEMMCLYCETEQAKKGGARFVTFRQTCEEGLIQGY